VGASLPERRNAERRRPDPVAVIDQPAVIVYGTVTVCRRSSGSTCLAGATCI